MFIGREFELKNMEKLYSKNEFGFVVMYGRRRVGKTTLLSEFCKNKPAIFFVAEEYNDKMALQSFSNKILEYFNMKAFISSFETWEKAFMFLAKQAETKQFVVVIDEFPYIVNSNKTIPSMLQNVIDHYLKNTKLFLIICGSSMSFFEKEVLSYKSPLYGRRTAQFKIQPFDFYNSSRFFKNYSLKEKIEAYAVLGGIPQYLLRFNDKLSIEENIKEEVLNRTSYLYDEPRNLLKQELREPAVYNSIIEAIAKGSTKINEISTKTGEPSDKCAKYIKTLLELRIITKETPVGEKESTRKSIYKIDDNLFRFWYRFVFDNVTFIEQEMIDYVYNNKIKGEISAYLGFIFEDICIQFLLKKNKALELPFVFEEIGRWWGNNPIKKRQEEIDILAVNKTDAIFGECKWKNEPIDMEVVNSLIEKSSILNYTNKYYFFFSKSSFSSAVTEYSKHNDNIFLYCVDDMFQ